MHNVLLVIARPRHILLPWFQRRAHRMHARHHPLFILINFGKHRRPNSRHDPHIHHRIRRVRQLHPNLRHWPPNRPHRIGEHIHRPPAHCPSEKLLQLLPHHERIFPIIRRPGRVLRKRADKRAVFDPRHIIGSRARQKAPGPQLLVQLRECPRVNQLIA